MWCSRVWWPTPQLGPASPHHRPLQPSLTNALLSICQSERPLPSSAPACPFSIVWIVHPLPSRCTQRASPSKEFGLECIYNLRLFITRHPARTPLPPTPLHVHPAQARNRLQQQQCSFPAGTSGWRGLAWLMVTLALPQCSGRAAPNLSKLWRGGVPVVHGSAVLDQPATAHIWARARQPPKSVDCLSALL